MIENNVGFICLYDHQWTALGNWTQHIAKSWTLKRKAQESDEFSAVCQGFENSKKACFVGLHELTGALKYACFCGIPKTDEKGFTTISGIDCRSVFNQTLRVKYGSSLPNNNMTVEKLFQYLMVGVFVEEGWVSYDDNTGTITDLKMGVSYKINLNDLSLLDTPWNEDYICRTDENRNVWEELLKVCACYDLYLMAEVTINSDNNKPQLTFKVHRIYNSRNIKLSDYNVKTKLNQNIVNRVNVRYGDSHTYYTTLYLYNDNTIGTSYDSSKVLFPPVTDTVDKETLDEALSDAYEILKENRFKDRVTIDLTSKLGSTLEDMDFSYYGELVGYNPADSSSVKRLPISGITTDSSGKKILEFGRLSEYWFLD